MKNAMNRKLAEALGWSSIVETGGALLGAPPAGQPETRGQALVPDWCGDWRACGPLLAAHGLATRTTAWDVSASCMEGFGGTAFEQVVDHGDIDAALRTAIVRASIQYLEARQ